MKRSHYIRSTDLETGLMEFYGEGGIWYQDPTRAKSFKSMAAAIEARDGQELFSRTGQQRFHLRIFTE